MALITDKPEDLEKRADELDAQAATQSALGKSGRYHAKQLQRAARQLRERAEQLRKRRTDGVRFG